MTRHCAPRRTVEHKQCDALAIVAEESRGGRVGVAGCVARLDISGLRAWAMSYYLSEAKPDANAAGGGAYGRVCVKDEQAREVAEFLAQGISAGLGSRSPTRLKPLGPVWRACGSPLGDRHLRPGGTVSGPAIMALCDAAMYVAILAAHRPRRARSNDQPVDQFSPQAGAGRPGRGVQTDEAREAARGRGSECLRNRKRGTRGTLCRDLFHSSPRCNLASGIKIPIF